MTSVKFLIRFLLIFLMTMGLTAASENDAMGAPKGASGNTASQAQRRTHHRTQKEPAKGIRRAPAWKRWLRSATVGLGITLAVNAGCEVANETIPREKTVLVVSNGGLSSNPRINRAENWIIRQLMAPFVIGGNVVRGRGVHWINNASRKEILGALAERKAVKSDSGGDAAESGSAKIPKYRRVYFLGHGDKGSYHTSSRALITDDLSQLVRRDAVIKHTCGSTTEGTPTFAQELGKDGGNHLRFKKTVWISNWIAAMVGAATDYKGAEIWGDGVSHLDLPRWLLEYESPTQRETRPVAADQRHAAIMTNEGPSGPLPAFKPEIKVLPPKRPLRFGKGHRGKE